MKLAEFDAPRFIDDVEKALVKKGQGAREKMRQRAGLTAGSLSYIFKKRAVTDIEIIMSMAWYLDLKPIDYMKRNDFQPLQEKHKHGWQGPSKIYDWKLVAGCAALLCAGDPVRLAAQVEGMKMNQAAAILKGNGIGSQELFKKMCKLMHLDPEVFLRADRRYKNLTQPLRRKDRKWPRTKFKEAA